MRSDDCFDELSHVVGISIGATDTLFVGFDGFALHTNDNFGFAFVYHDDDDGWIWNDDIKSTVDDVEVFQHKADLLIETQQFLHDWDWGSLTYQ